MERDYSSNYVDISAILPSYNKGRVLPLCVERLVNVLDGITSFWEIIVVDDGSTDDTWRRIMDLVSLDPRIKGLRVSRNVGKGFALKRGFLESSGHLIIFLDADTDINPRAIPYYLKLISSGADMVIGSKRHTKSIVVYGARSREILSKGYSFLVRKLLRLPFLDTQTGIKVIKREVLENLILFSSRMGFTFDVELLDLAVKAGYKVIEGPVEVRYSPNSSVGLKSIILMFLDTIKLAVTSNSRVPAVTEKIEGITVPTSHRGREEVLV